MVTDDKVATFHGQGTHWAVPSHPNHRPYRKFEDLGMRVDRFNPRARPVDAVYRLVRAEPGAAVSIRAVRPVPRLILMAMAIRYLGEEGGRAYVESTGAEDDITVLIEPDVWFTVDYGKTMGQ